MAQSYKFQDSIILDFGPTFRADAQTAGDCSPVKCTNMVILSTNPRPVADGQKHLVSLQPLTYDADVAQMSSASLPDREHVSPRWSAGTRLLKRSRWPRQTMVSSLSALSYPGKLGVLIVAG